MHRGVQDQNEEVEASPIFQGLEDADISSTFQQLEEDKPVQRVGQEKGTTYRFQINKGPRRQTLKMKNEIKKSKKRKRPNKSKKPKGKRIKSGGAATNGKPSQVLLF